MPNLPQRILVHLRWRFQFGQDVVTGIVDCVGGRRVEILTANGESALTQEQIATLKPGVIIGDSFYAETRRAAFELGVPFIDVTGSTPAEGIHRILVDDHTIGRMARLFLREQGVGSYAFVGFSDQAYSRRRFDAFSSANTGDDIQFYESPLAPEVIGGRDRKLVAFLRTLPLPCAIFACSDLRAMDVIVAAALAGLSIPADLRVLGVDVDRTLRGITRRRLTSIDQSAWFVGWQAGELALRLLRKAGLSLEQQLLPALRVVAGDTTTQGRVDDPIVQRLMQALDRHVADPGALGLAIASIPLSRRAIEGRVRATLGMTPLQLLHERRFEEAIRLLADPARSISEISLRLGFEYPGDFTRFLKRRLGVTPSALRRRLTQMD